MPSCCPGSVLVVEDELAHQRILASILRGEGYCVRVATNAAEAMTAARAARPDLILLDACLPDGSGHTLCRALRDELGLAETPVIFISAAHDAASKVRAFGLGAVDYVDKPFHVAEVLARVRSHLQIHRLTQDLAERSVALQQANERLVRELAARDRGLACLSHELRTPLNTVLGLTQLLCDGVYGTLDEPQRRAIGLIAESGEHLLGLVNDLLDLARIEAGREALRLGQVDLVAACRTSLDLVRPIASAAGVDLVERWHPDLAPICADQRRVVQILLNLLANALRFTPAGGQVGLEVSPGPRGAGARLTVWDCGPGIPPEQLARLFFPFAQLEGADWRGGTGLGLALVAQLARMHGGAVAFEGGAGGGSRFSVALPAQAPVADAAPSQDPAPCAPLALIVDEYGPTAAALAAELGRVGLRCLITTEPVGLGALAPACAPAVALVALPMADHQGDELLPRLRSGPLGGVPLLAIGTVQLPSSAERALRLGADAYLPRPLDSAALTAALAGLGLPLPA